MRNHRVPGLVVLLLVCLIASCTYPSGPRLPPTGAVPPGTEMPTSVDQPGATDVPGQGGPAPAFIILAEALTKAGARVQAGGEISQPFFSVPGRILRVNGADVQTFSYPDVATAAQEASLITPDGGSAGGSSMSWTAPPHFFRKGGLTALYVGRDGSVLTALEESLGPQFAGAPTATAVTPGPAAGQISGQVWHDVCDYQGEGGESTSSPSATAGCVKTQAGGLRGNGILEGNEGGAQAVRVSLGAGACPANEQVSALSDVGGVYDFRGLAAGAYCVYVDALSPANAALMPGQWTFPSSSDGGTASATIMLGEGEARSGVNFGWDYKLLPAPPTPTPVGQAAASPAPGGTPKACTDRATMLRDVTIPDNMRIPAGKSFEKVWQLRNIGTCTWDAGYALVFAGGEQMGGPEAVPFAQDVRPGANVNVTVTLTSPFELRTHRGDWKLRNSGGQVFGIGRTGDRTFWVQIVTTAAPTATPTPAPVETATTAPALPTPALPAAPPPTVPSATVIQRNVLPPGSVMTSFSTNLRRGQPKAYSLQAEAGQAMRISLDNTTAIPVVYDPDGTVVTPVTTGNDGRFSYQLLMTGEYVIVLEGNGATVITIELPPVDSTLAGSLEAG